MPREAYVFSQFLRLLPRYEFQRIVDKYNSHRRPQRWVIYLPNDRSWP